MVSAWDWIDLAVCSGVWEPRASFSSSASRTLATCSHVGYGGGVLASLSCSPKTASCLSPVSAGSCQAACTAGRDLTVVYHLACTFGSLSHCRNFQAASRFFAFLNTAMADPPTK